ncbi:MAG: hypothetical protein IKJ70_06415 [Clostridia bacterium]|nr:hypothetical protein [Clostridia bacterium]
MKKLIPIILLFVLLIGILTTVIKTRMDSPAEDPVSTSVTIPTEEKSGEIRLGYFKEKSLNPYKTTSTFNRNLSTLIYDSLFVIEDDFSALPLIAESFTNEGNKLTVKINSEIYFSDGSLVTTADVAYSFRMAKDDEFYSKRLSNFNTAVKGDESVIFTMQHSDIYAESNLVFPIIKIGSAGDKYPVGSGRYKVKKSGGKLYLKANEYSTHGEEMATDTIRLTPISADKTELYLLQTGDLTTYFDDLSSGSFTKINANMVRVPLNNLLYIGLNSNNKFLKDNAVKKAIELCTDKRTICDGIYGGYCRKTETVFNPDWHLSKTYEAKESEFSAIKAGEVLEEANYVYAYKKNKFRSKNFEFLKLKFIVNEENKLRVEAAKLITKNLRLAGFDVSLQKLPFSEYQTAIKNGSFDLYLGEIVLSPGMDLSVFFSSDGELSAGVGANQTASDAYFDFVSGTVDFSTFNQVMAHEKPIIPICYRDGMVCFSRALSYEGSVNHYDLYKNVYSWEIK